MSNTKKGNKAAEANDMDKDSLGVDMTGALLQLVLKVTEVLTSNATLNTELNSLKLQIAELKETNQKLSDRVVKLEQCSGQQQKHWSAPVDDVMALTTKVAEEITERKGKEQNFVIQGLPESNPPTESGGDCQNEVCTILRSIGVTNPVLSRTFRMGAVQPNKPRPIKVMCGDENTRRLTLENAKRLKNLPNGHPNKRVFIRPDLTYMQRQADYQRRQELRRKREAEESRGSSSGRNVSFQESQNSNRSTYNLRSQPNSEPNTQNTPQVPNEDQPQTNSTNTPAAST